MRDIVGPGRATVGFAGEGVALKALIECPGSAEVGGGERAVVTAVVSHSLDDHEVSVLVFELVDLDGFEELLLGIGQDDGGGRAEVAREVVQRHAGAVDLAVVSCEEQVHVPAVTDEGLIDGTGVRAGNGPGEERLRSGPSVGIGRVGRCPVAEGSGSPLVCKDPDVLRGKEEQGGCNGRAAHAVLADRSHAGPVAERAEVHGAIVPAVEV